MNRRTLMKGSLTLGAGALLAGCSEPPTPRPTSSSKVLLAYFSRPGENYHYGGRIDLAVGNTEVLADMIASTVTVDVYRIQAADPYPQSYQATVERNKNEQDAEARPAITGALPAVESYGAVLLGSPIWNVRPPMIMRTFIDGVDLRGKTIHPFVTYAVSGMGNTVDDYTRLCPEATIGEGLAVRGEEVRDAQTDMMSWLQRIPQFAK
ncbi:MULTISPECIES: flavodoxin [unclassified Mycobacterium]|uniref:flavodoxin n=1 Tax=unclassified Mycobacterium TaxID=2642494 RepID=UPI0029C7B9D8|nr:MULTISPECIES: flavodoxin [unclassified Mycobacterium]